MEKRTTLMIATDILLITRIGSNKTNIVYQGNLNFHILKKWIPRLISKGLLEECDKPPRTWRTTDKGLRFIDAMERVLGIWENEAIILDDLTIEAV